MEGLNELYAHRREILRALRNHKWERRDDGALVLPEQGFAVNGAWAVSVNGGPVEISPNLVTTEGLVYQLESSLGGGTRYTDWYVAPFKSDVTPAAGDEATSFVATYGELTEYDESPRPTWTVPVASSLTLDNSANRSVFTLNAGVTVRGAALLSWSSAGVEGSASDVIFCASRFGSDRTLVSGDELSIQYGITVADDGV